MSVDFKNILPRKAKRRQSTIYQSTILMKILPHICSPFARMMMMNTSLSHCVASWEALTETSKSKVPILYLPEQWSRFPLLRDCLKAKQKNLKKQQHWKCIFNHCLITAETWWKLFFQDVEIMAIEAGFEKTKNISNHSARKHLVQKLRDSNIAPTEIMQITGHKNVQSIINYSEISISISRLMSRVICIALPS